MRKMMILSAFVAAAAIAAPSYAQTAPPAPESGAEQAPDQTMPSEAEPDTQEAPDQATPPAPQPGPQSGMSTNGDSAPIQMLPKSPVVQSTADTQAPAEYPRCTASKKDECRNPGGV